jgi:two-component system nitrate/nitrite response regulator NarL
MRVLLAGSSTLFRQGLRTLLKVRPEIEVLGEAVDSWEAVVETRRLAPDLLILEIDPPLASGLEHIGRIREDAPATRVLVLTDSEREEDFWQALRRGVHGYLLKKCDSEELFRAIAGVMKGELAVSPSVGGRALRGLVLRREDATGVRDRLTPREKEVLRLLGEGLSDRDIGRQLSLSASTVGHHVHNILRKLHLKNRVQAATLATTDESCFESGLESGQWADRS